MTKECSRRKSIKKFPKAELFCCKDSAHREGCYIKLTNEKVESSTEQKVLFDLNKKGEIIGIDLIIG